MAAAAVVSRAAVLAVDLHRVGEVGGGGVDAHEAAQVRDQDIPVLAAHLAKSENSNFPPVFIKVS